MSDSDVVTMDVVCLARHVPIMRAALRAAGLGLYEWPDAPGTYVVTVYATEHTGVRP
jgi:hypothetical protein